MKPIIIPVYQDGKEKVVTMGYEDFCRIIETVYDGGMKDGIEKQSLSTPTKPNTPNFTEPIWRSPNDSDKICGVVTPVPTATLNATVTQPKTPNYEPAFPFRVYGRDSENITGEKSFENILQDLKNGKNPLISD